MTTLFPSQKIAAELRARLQQGHYRQRRLPSEREFMAEFGVQRDTVRRALRTLRRRR